MSPHWFGTLDSDRRPSRANPHPHHTKPIAMQRAACTRTHEVSPGTVPSQKPNRDRRGRHDT